MGLAERLRRLEHRDQSGACPDCGHLPGMPEIGTVHFIIHTEPYDGPHRCQACGRLLWFTLTLDRPGDDPGRFAP